MAGLLVLGFRGEFIAQGDRDKFHADAPMLCIGADHDSLFSVA
ncbi:hypothetical protein [Roseicyclus sp.]